MKFDKEDQYTSVVMSHSVSLKMRNVSDERCIENQNTHFVFSNGLPPPQKNRTVYETVWENMVEPDKPRTTVWRTRIAWWATKATNTHSE
jgi:hypothetical protein